MEETKQDLTLERKRSIKYPFATETDILRKLLNFETATGKNLSSLVLGKLIDVAGLLSNGNLLANACGPTHKPTNICS